MNIVGINRTISSRIISIILCSSLILLAIPSRVYAGNTTIDSILNNAQSIKDTVVDNANEAKDSADQTTNTIRNELYSAYNSTSQYVNNILTNIDKEKFKRGWDTASKLAAVNLSSTRSTAYVSSVQKAITDAQKNLYSVVNKNSTLASNAGFVAEEWHTSTFNIDAAAKGSKYKAERPASTAKASSDINITKNGDIVQKIGSKYYKDGTASAKAQSKTIIQNYKEYQANAQKTGKEIMSLDDYLDANVNLKDAYKILDSEYASEYAGQTRLIPADQMDSAASYLRKQIGKEASKDKNTRTALSKSYQETLDSLAKKITAKDGTQSIPLTEDEAKALVDLCENGDFDIEDFKGLRTSQVIKPKYILKQSMISGSYAAALEIALTVGPEIYSIISDGIKKGYIDENQLKKAGIDAAFAGANGFVEGSVSAAIITASQAGKLGVAGKNLSPDAIGMLTVLTIDAIKYGYKLNNDEITIEEYGDLMAEEIFVAIISGCSGALLQVLLPFIPFAYLAGSMVGGMIASAAYESGKEIALQVAAGNGFEVIMPVEAKDTINIGKDMVASVNINKIKNEVSNTVINTTTDGVIKLKALRN